METHLHVDIQLRTDVLSLEFSGYFSMDSYWGQTVWFRFMNSFYKKLIAGAKVFLHLFVALSLSLFLLEMSLSEMAR